MKTSPDNSPENDMAQLSDDITAYLRTAKNTTESEREIEQLLSTVEQYLPENTTPLELAQTTEDLEQDDRKQRLAEIRKDIGPKPFGLEPKFDTEGLSDLEIDQLYADMNPYEVFQQAVGNMDENSAEILEGLGKLVKETLPWLSLETIGKTWAWSHLQKEDSMLRALGYLVLGAGYNAMQVASHFTPDPSLRRFFGSQLVKDAMQPYESVFHAMVDMYKKNYGLDGRGMIGLKRYIGEQPMDFLGDMLTFVSFATTGASIGAKAGSLSLKSSQLSQLNFQKFFTRNFRNYFNRSGKVDRIFGRLQRRIEQIHGKLPHLLDYVHEKTWYIGTGVKGGNYPPGYWATLAYYVLQYGDVGNIPFALGGEAINVIGMAGTLSKSTKYSDELDDIATELFQKFHRDAPERPPHAYTLTDLHYMETYGKDVYTPFVLGYDISNVNINNPVRFVRVRKKHVPRISVGDKFIQHNEALSDLYTPHIYVGDDPSEFFDAYKSSDFELSNITENLDSLTTDKLRAEGKLRPLDELTDEELATYRIVPTDFDIETFILNADGKKQDLPTVRDLDVPGEPEFSYQIKSNQRLLELQEDISNFFDKDLIDSDNIKQEIYEFFREKGGELYDELDEILGSFTRGGHNYSGINIETLPMISYFEKTMEVWESRRFGVGHPIYQTDLPETERKFLEGLFEKLGYLHDDIEHGTSESRLLDMLSGMQPDHMIYGKSVEGNLDALTNLIIDASTGYTGGSVRLKLEHAIQKYMYANANFLDTSFHGRKYNSTIGESEELNKTIGTLRYLQELFLTKSLEFPNSKTYLELYNSVTEDYYQNIRQNIQNSTAMDHPVIKHIFEKEMSGLRKRMGEEKYADLYETLVTNARTNESFITNTILNKYDSLSHITDDYDRGMALIDFIKNEMDIENLAFWNDRIESMVKARFYDDPKLGEEVADVLQDITYHKKELARRADFTYYSFQVTGEEVNSNFTKFLFTAIENMDNPRQARMVSRAFLDPELIPSEAIPQLFHQVSDETKDQIRASVARELMQRAQTWDGLGFRIVSFEFEDIFTQISRDWELGGLIERIRTVANYPDGSATHANAMTVLKEYLEEVFNNRTYFDEPFDDVMIDEVVKIARKGNAGLIELLEYFQPYGGAHFFDSEVNVYGHDWLHLLVGHDGVYAADNIQQGFEFWDSGNNVARGHTALIVFEYVDSGGYGIDKVEKILQPTRVVGVYNPWDFYKAYQSGKNMWRNADNLRAQIRRVGEERLRLLWGDEYLESFKKFAKLSEDYPLLTSGGRERVKETVNFEQVRTTEEQLQSAKSEKFGPADPTEDADVNPPTTLDADPTTTFLDNLIAGLEEGKKTLEKPIEEGKVPEEGHFGELDTTIPFDEADETTQFDQIEPVEPDDWTDEIDDTAKFLGTAVNPATPLYQAVQETGLPKILDNTDPALNNLELLLSTLDIEMVMKIVTSPAMIELIVKDLPPKQQAKIRSWLTIYRRAERKLYENTKKKKEKKEKQKSQRKQNSYNRSGNNLLGRRLLVQ